MQPVVMSKIDYSQALWIKALRYVTLYEEALLKSLFFEGLEGFIRHNIRNHLEIHPELDLSMFAR